jgi:hypothetical protein
MPNVRRRTPRSSSHSLELDAWLDSPAAVEFFLNEDTTRERRSALSYELHRLLGLLPWEPTPDCVLQSPTPPPYWRATDSGRWEEILKRVEALWDEVERRHP